MDASPAASPAESDSLVGIPTGRLFSLDAWLRDRLAGEPSDRLAPGLAAYAARAARFRVTGSADDDRVQVCAESGQRGGGLP